MRLALNTAKDDVMLNTSAIDGRTIGVLSAVIFLIGLYMILVKSLAVLTLG
jgi:hypothetical protein